MKNIFVILVSFIAVSFGLNSCSPEPHVEPIERYGTFDGTFNSNGEYVTILLAPNGGSEIYEDEAFSLFIDESSSIDKLRMMVRVHVKHNGSKIPIPFEVDVNYDALTSTFAAVPNIDYSFEVMNLPVQFKLVSFEGDFTSDTAVEGTIVLDDHSAATQDLIEATFLFDASK